jgi:hypothetical protein
MTVLGGEVIVASMRFRRRDKTISTKDKSAWHSTILQ